MSSASAPQGDARTLRVLVVDDTPDIRSMVPLQLKMDRLTFEEAASGEEALARCGSESFDLIVLDYRMPGLTGLEVARRLRSEHHPAKIVVYSAYLDEKVRVEAQALDVPVVDKPDNERLRETVRATMGLVPA